MRDQRGIRLLFKGEFWDGRENKGGFRGGRKEKPLCVILQARSSRSRSSTGTGETREKVKAW